MKFFAMFIAISLLGYVFIGMRLLSQRWQWGVLFIPFSFLIAFPFYRDSVLIANLAFVAMGFLSYLFVLVILRDIFSKLFHTKKVGALRLSIVASLAVGVGTYKAINGIETVQVKVPVKNLPAELNGLRIVQISDLHIGPTIGKSLLKMLSPESMT